MRAAAGFIHQDGVLLVFRDLLKHIGSNDNVKRGIPRNTLFQEPSAVTCQLTAPEEPTKNAACA
jgi:hypothetical protein